MENKSDSDPNIEIKDVYIHSSEIKKVKMVDGKLKFASNQKEDAKKEEFNFLKDLILFNEHGKRVDLNGNLLDTEGKIIAKQKGKEAKIKEETIKKETIQKQKAKIKPLQKETENVEGFRSIITSIRPSIETDISFYYFNNQFVEDALIRDMKLYKKIYKILKIQNKEQYFDLELQMDESTYPEQIEKMLNYFESMAKTENVIQTEQFSVEITRDKNLFKLTLVDLEKYEVDEKEFKSFKEVKDYLKQKKIEKKIMNELEKIFTDD